MTVALFTSIPATATRRDRSGNDIGADYLARCVASWVAAGYRVVSVNGAAEAALLAPRYPAIEVRAIARTAEAKTGRPLIHLADVLAECAAAPEPLVGVINADLFFHAPEALAGFLAQADGRTLLYGSRLDVDDLDAPGAARAYVIGLDYFFFAPAMVADLADEGFLIGETWWDYWLPIALAKRGCGLKVAAAPLALHLRHDESSIAMRAPTYLEYFQAFARALTVRLPLPGTEPWAVEVRPLLAAFLRHQRAAGPAEQIWLSQFLSLALSLYLAQRPGLFATFAAAWRALCDAAPEAAGRAFAASLLDTATALAADQAKP
jgi:hypothetical protein